MTDIATQRTGPVDASSRRPVVMVVGARGIPDVEGGAEKNAEMLFPLVVAAGYRVVLFGLDGLIKGDVHRGVELRRAPNRRVLNTDKLFYYLAAIRAAREIRPDIVHLQGLGASLFLFAYRLGGAKTVVRYGSADYIVDKWGLVGRIGFRIAEYQTRLADAVVAVAPSLVARLARKGITRNVHFIANAVDDPPPAAGVPPPAAAGNSPFVLFVGRVTAQKNVVRLIEGFRRFNAANGGRYKFLIAGGLEDESYVASLAELTDETILLLGRCNRAELESLYRHCAIYVNGSVHEGMSNAVLEAISRECPVLLSDIPENRDFQLAEHSYFDPESVDAIADALGAAAVAPDRFRADRSRFMTWQAVADKTLAIYRAILK